MSSIRKYPEPQPTKRLILEEALTGRTLAEGVFTNSLTGGKTGFTVVIDGAWDGTTLTLVEDFAFDSGVQERKTWRSPKPAKALTAERVKT